MKLLNELLGLYEVSVPAGELSSDDTQLASFFRMKANLLKQLTNINTKIDARQKQLNQKMT